MPYRGYDNDGNPLIYATDLEYLLSQARGYAADAAHVRGAYRARKGLRLELVLIVDQASLDCFTESVCEDLAESMSTWVGFEHVLVYVEGHPHDKARRILRRSDPSPY